MIARTFRVGWALGGSVALILASSLSSVHAQVRDQVIVFGVEAVTGTPLVHRYGRDLSLKGESDITSLGLLQLTKDTPLAVDGNGSYWIANDPLTYTKLLRLDRDGGLLPTTLLGHPPVNVVVSKEGFAFALTRIPLLSPGPMYGVLPDGTVRWVSWDGPQDWIWYPRYSAITPAGNLWMGGSTIGVPGQSYSAPMLKEIDMATGSTLQTLLPPALNEAMNLGTVMTIFRAAPDGTLWMGLNDVSKVGFEMYQYSGQTLVSQITIDHMGLASANQIRIDASGDLWCPSEDNEEGVFGGILYHYSHVDGSLIREYSFPGTITGFAFGPSGEDLFATYGFLVTGEIHFSMGRVNVVSGALSTIPLVPPLHSTALAPGDPTGFVFANVIDQQGDNDADGHANYVETLAGSNPFDAKSVPSGPKIYLSFLPDNNAIVLRLHDPSGLLHPTEGIDPASIRVEAGPYGDIFPLLLSFQTKLTLSADGRDASIEFGGLPIPSDLRLRVTVSVKDKQGAKGWDWQVTPPGNL